MSQSAKPSWCLEVRTWYWAPAVPEQLHPGTRVEAFGAEPRDEVVVGEGLAVGLAVVGIGGVAGVLHLVPVPLGVLRADRRPGGYRVDPPVDEDPELRLLEPVRRLVGGEGGVRRCVVGDTEGERAPDRGRPRPSSVRDNVAVPGGAGCGAGSAADADADAGLFAGGEAADAGGRDGTGSGHVHGEGEAVGGEDADGARVDDGGLHALGTGVQQRGGGVGVAKRQRPSLGSRLEREREDVQGRLAGLGGLGGRQGERHGFPGRVERDLADRDGHRMLVLGAVGGVAVRGGEGAAAAVPVGPAERRGRRGAVRVVDRGPAGRGTVAARGEEETGEVAAGRQVDALAEGDDIVLGPGRGAGEEEGGAADLPFSGGEFLTREGVAGSVEVAAAGVGGVDSVVVEPRVERHGDGGGNGAPPAAVRAGSGARGGRGVRGRIGGGGGEQGGADCRPCRHSEYMASGKFGHDIR